MLKRGLKLESLRKLEKGQIDLWITSDQGARDMACQKGVGGLFVVWRLYTADLYLALDRQPPGEVVQKLRKALNQLRAEGDLQAIGARY